MDVESAAEAYVSKLEQQNRYLRTLLCLVGLILGCVLLTGEAGVPKVLTAEKFVLVDSGGKIRAELYAHKEESVLRLHGANESLLTLQAGDQVSLLRIEQGEDSSAEMRVSATTAWATGPPSSEDRVIGAGFHLRTGGQHSGSSNVDVAAGTVTDTVNPVIGWQETIDAPVVKLSRGREAVFVTPQPPPRRRLGH